MPAKIKHFLTFLFLGIAIGLAVGAYAAVFDERMVLQDRSE